MANKLTGNWTLYRKVTDSGMWMWFEVQRIRMGLSQSDAVKQAVSDWLRKNDPTGTNRQDPLG